MHQPTGQVVYSLTNLSLLSRQSTIILSHDSISQSSEQDVLTFSVCGYPMIPAHAPLCGASHIYILYTHDTCLFVLFSSRHSGVVLER